MNALDDMIAGARARLDTALDGHPVPLAPPPRQHRVLPVLVVAMLIVAAVVVAGWLRPDERVAPASPPPELATGHYGDEVTMVEVDDGDGNPDTVLLRGDPDAGEVRIYPADAATTATTAASAAPSPSVAAAPGSPANEVCIDAAGAGGVCAAEATLGREPMLQIGPRGATGQAVVTGVPDDVYAVAYESGAVRRWARPLRGIVVFPRPDEAASAATVTGIGLDGTTVFTQSADDQLLSNPEVDELAAGRLSDATLAGGWYAAVPPDGTAGLTVTRRTGRHATGVGFAGPFTAQTFSTGGGYSTQDMAPTVWVLTVRTTDVADLDRLLATATDGAVRHTAEITPGVTVVVWAGDAVTPAEVDAAVASLTTTVPDHALDVTSPRAWRSADRGPVMPMLGSPLEALLTVPVATFDGGEIIAQPDDVGATTHWLVTDDDAGRRLATMITLGGPGNDDFELEQLVGLTLSSTLLVVERDVTAVTVETAAGDVDATLVPIEDPVPLQLVALLPATPHAAVTAVHVTR